MAEDIANQEVDTELTDNGADFQAPYPGDKSMPQWDTGGLIDAPKFTFKKWIGMLGPGLILGGAAIGGGEWLVGPQVTAQYGGALLWLATFSIIGQVIYNLEISRYTLYSGEPIFTGKFRTHPGKKFWTACYLILDAGSIFPYLAMTAAIPLFAALFGLVPTPEDGEAMIDLFGMELSHAATVKTFGLTIFAVALIPLIFGGKIHVALKWVMGFKIVTVMGFLLILAIGWSSVGTWTEIFTGFVKVGTVPIERVDDMNGNGQLDEGEDWDGDGVLDVVEPQFNFFKGSTVALFDNATLDDGKVQLDSAELDVLADDGEWVTQVLAHDDGRLEAVPAQSFWSELTGANYEGAGTVYDVLSIDSKNQSDIAPSVILKEGDSAIGLDINRDGKVDAGEPLALASAMKTTIDISIDLNPHTDNVIEMTASYEVGAGKGFYHDVLELEEKAGLEVSGTFPLRFDNVGKGFVDIDGDEERDGAGVANIFDSLFSGEGFPKIDWALIASLSALVAISGSGGLSNTPISNYTRDEGWGMGHHVGAIPSVVGGLEISLSHQGTVFNPDAPGAMPRWRRWFKHVMRDQLVIWLPACFIGLALPSMLSVEFLDRGVTVPDKWVAATMTADGVASAVAGIEIPDNISDLSDAERGDLETQVEEARQEGLGKTFWFLTIFCGFLVLAPSMSTSADGIIRRWVDVFWTTSDKLRSMPPEEIRMVYFKVLACYALFGFVMLGFFKPDTLLKIATTIYNYALGISCLHTVYVNRSLLPKKLQPRKSVWLALVFFGVFFLFIALVSTLAQLDVI